MGFLAIFAGLNLINTQRGYMDASILVAGVVAGSCIWWLTLVVIFGFICSKFEISCLGALNKIVGIVIVIMGLFTIIVQHKLPLPSQQNHEQAAVETVKKR